MDVCKRCSSRLIDDTEDVESCNNPGIFGRLPLAVGEVSGHRDDRLSHGFLQVGLSCALDLLENQRRELLGCVVFALDLDNSHVLIAARDGVVHQSRLVADIVKLLTDEALERMDGRSGIDEQLSLGDVTDEASPIFGEADDRRGDPSAFFADHHLGLTALDDGANRVCSSEVNSDNFGHNAPIIHQ